MTASFDAALTNLATQIATKAATASPEELAYLAKAMESIGGKAAVLDVQMLADKRSVDLNTLGDARETAFRALADRRVDEFDRNAAGRKAIFDENAAAKLKSYDDNSSAKTTAFNNNAAAKQVDFDTNSGNFNPRLTNAESRIAGFGSDLPIRKFFSSNRMNLAVGELALSIELDAPKSLDFTLLDFYLPAAASVPAFFTDRELVIKNRTLARIRVRSNSGRVLAILPPYAFGRLVRTAFASDAEAWQLTVLDAPSVRDRPLVVASSDLPMNYGDFYGWNRGSGIFGGASYSDNLFAIPHLDDTGTSLKVALLTTVSQTSNGYRGLLIGAAPIDGWASAVSWNYGFSSTAYHWSGHACEWSAIPVRGGIVTFGAVSQVGRFEVNYIRPPYSNIVGVIAESYSGAGAPRFCQAITFDDGRYLVLILFNSSGQLTSVRRFRFNGDGTVTAAGNLTMPQSGAAVYPVNDRTLALTQNGTQLQIFDVTAAGNGWTPTATIANPFPQAPMSNQVAMMVGRDSILASDGAYQFDGVQTFTKAGDAGPGYILPSSALSGGKYAAFHCANGLMVNDERLWSQGDSRAFYFTEAGGFTSRALEKVVGQGAWARNQLSARLTPMGGDAVFASFAAVYGANSSHEVACSVSTTSLSRIAAGNIGLNSQGGKI